MIKLQRVRNLNARTYLDWEPMLDYSKYARKILKDILGLNRGENLTIEAWQHQLNFANEIKHQARLMGANVVLITEDENRYWRLFDQNRENSLGKVGNHEWALLESSDAYVFFPGPGDLQKEMSIDQGRRSSSTAYNYGWYKRATNSNVRGVRVLSSYATPSRAKVYGLDRVKWYRNALDALDVDYQKVDSEGRKLARAFRGKMIEISAPNGTRIKMKISNTNPHVYSGLMNRNPRYNEYSVLMTVPGGEVDIVPVRETVEGRIIFNCPVLRMGKKIEGLKWVFEKGKLERYSASKQIESFEEPYHAAKGDKDRVGVLAIGLNPKIAYGFNNDLSVRGAVTLGVGSFGEGDKNKTGFALFGTLSNATLRSGSSTLIQGGKLL